MKYFNTSIYKKSLLMKQIFILLIVILNLFSNKVYAVNKISVTVVKIEDGDTINVKLKNNNSFSVRLIGIDCFETSKIYRSYKQAYTNNLSIDKVIEKGILSKQFLEELYQNSNQQVFLEFMGLDKYKRVLGIIYFGNINVNELMKTNGGCFPYEYYEK